MARVTITEESHRLGFKSVDVIQPSSVTGVMAGYRAVVQIIFKGSLPLDDVVNVEGTRVSHETFVASPSKGRLTVASHRSRRRLWLSPPALASSSFTRSSSSETATKQLRHCAAPYRFSSNFAISFEANHISSDRQSTSVGLVEESIPAPTLRIACRRRIQGDGSHALRAGPASLSNPAYRLPRPSF